ncbi:MAG: LacI family DNA-binding transcriptional regulator [Candidatus Dormiibacterota bacterium]
MREVARRAGVSISTVSYVLNGGPRPVSAAVRERVREAMLEVGYQSAVRGRPRRRPLAIGALVPDATNSFFASVLQGAISVLSPEGHLLLTASSGESPGREVEEFRALRRAGIQGLLLTPRGGVPDDIEAAARAGLPVVLMDRDGGSDRFARVVMANYRNSVRAVRVLADSGHRRIALVNGPSQVSTARERLRGYTDALAQSGLAFRQDFVDLGSFTTEHGRRAARALMSLPEPPEAIFISSAILTVGVLQALRERRLAWPDDVALIGYGDPPWAALLSPPLTVIDQPREEIGATAARVLLDGGGTGQGARLVLDSHLVLRESHWRVVGPRIERAAG